VDSLKKIDPLDCTGDGSGSLLSAGDMAIVANAVGAIAFYVLKEGTGMMDTGIMVVIPERNPGIFYWACCGSSKNKVTALAGERFLFSGGSKVPPTGFIGGDAPYSMISLQIYDAPGTADYSWYGVGVVDMIMYVICRDDLWIFNLVTGDFTAETVVNTETMWNTPSHCTLDEESANYIVDFCGDTSTLKRFNIVSKEASPIPFQFIGGDSSWSSIIGYDGYPWFAIKVGNYYYGWWGDDAATAIGVKVNVLTGVVSRIDDAPGFIDGGVCIPDFDGLHIFFISENSFEVYRYDITSDTWDSFPNFPGELWWGWCGYFDTESNSLIVPSWGDEVCILDVVTGTWSRYGCTVDDILSDGYAVYYKDIGAIWAFALEDNDGHKHGLIAKNNPYYIEKI
jgi:hypothetical protein